jgi:hypothetical protein
MNLHLKKLTFLSICYNDPGITATTQSIQPFLKLGSRHIIQNGGQPLNSNEFPMSKVYNEVDTGIYNAINKAISKADTEYFMLLHAGDTIVGTISDFETILVNLDSHDSNLSLNNQLIGSRPHFSNLWRPWMLTFGAQPPHLPTIFRSTIFKDIPYSEDIPTIADFDFFRSLKWTNYTRDNKLLVKMANGGKTSSGMKSFFYVNRCFLSTYGQKGWIYVIFRVPLKILQFIKT